MEWSEITEHQESPLGAIENLQASDQLDESRVG
jgi:hypothetical protein